MHYCEKGICSGRRPASHKKLVVLSSYPFAMVWNTHIKVMYTRAVWREGTREEEGVVPDSWIDREMKTVRWPRKMSVTKTEKAIKDKINPQDDWMTFSLIKIKMTSDKRRECDAYNLTSQTEEDDEVITSTRKRTKKGIPEGFVRNELTDSDESVRGVKLPPFPTAPRKLQPIEDTNMLHNTSHEDGAMSGPVERADSPRGSEMSTPNSASQTLDGLVEACSGSEKYAARSRRKEMSNASTALRSRDLSTPRSRHARDGYRSRSSSGSTIRSWHSDFERPTFRSRDDGSRHSDVRSRHDRSRSDAPSPPARSRHDKRAQQCDDRSRSDERLWRCDDQSRSNAPSPSARSTHDERAQRSDLSRPPYDRLDAVTETGRWAFPLPCGVFQKKVLSLLVDIRHRLKETQPASSAVRIERMDTMEDFELQEQSLSDAQAFDTLVLQISRIGGRNTKDCAHKVLDRLFTNSLMAKFNLKGKGKRGKRPLEGTKVYRAIQEGIMKFDNAATEEFIKGNAPQRIGGGGFAMP
ncbi:hypothetical protein QQF64_011506 [Cirrhinus molitorella]|uniref:DUF4806 domain-containing protein n=1 Tax=Cirrhinus molitorella TaxID=172907 RepID=A0ABR3LZE7_9TELE